MNIDFNFGPGFGFGIPDLMNLHIEVKLGTAIVQSDALQAPYQVMLQHCQSMVNEIANSQEPMKITMSSTKEVQLPNGDWVDKPSKLIYANNAYLNNFDIEE